MKPKHKLNAILTVFLLSSLTIPSTVFSGTWMKNNEKWYYEENNKKLTNWQNINNNYYYFDNDGKMYTGWLKDKDNSFYFLENEKNSNEGILSSGWKLINSNWYFLNNKHDGFFGKMLTGWHWIDSKCYYFDISNGNMLVNTKTPDGYIVNADGQWIVNGKIQIGNSEYTTHANTISNTINNSQKPITFNSSSSGGGGGSIGSSISSGKSSNFNNSTKTEDPSIITIPQKEMYSYSIKYVNEDGVVIKKIDGNKENGSIIEIDKSEIKDYTFETEDNFVLTKNTEKIIKLKETTKKRKTLYTISFKSRDNKTDILPNVNGEGILDEEIPIYFQKYVNLSDGTKWMAIENSPKTFMLNSITNNNFTIHYINIGKMEKEKLPNFSYSIKYIANDTNAILGIATGYAKQNDVIPFRNNFIGYTIEDENINYLKINSNKNNNDIEVKMKRTAFPGPEKENGKYKGFNWDAYFVDENGNQLLPSQKGFTLNNTNLIFDYPNEINIADGYVYKAKVQSPYNKQLEGTSYRQIVIVYKKGENPSDKLEKYKNESLLLSNDFNKKNNVEYTVRYKEQNSWNDIAIYKNIGHEGTKINIQNVKINGYVNNSNLNSFILNKNSNEKEVYYERYDNQNSSLKNIKQNYTISFKDGEKDIMNEVSGKIALENDETIGKISVFFPNKVTDEYGNIYQSKETSPKTFTIDYLNDKTWNNVIEYKQIYKNKKDQFVINNEKEGLNILKNYFSRTKDAETKELMLIGKNINPKNMIPNEILSLFNIKNYNVYDIDTFNDGKDTYFVSKITYNKNFANEDADEENWELIETTDGDCLTQGSEIYENTRTKETIEVKIPAKGHVDEDLDGIDDVCGKLYKNIRIGDEINVSFDGKNNNLGKHNYTYLCIDDNYNGIKGRKLFISNETIPSEIYGEYSSGDYNFNNSDLRTFLNDVFIDGTVIKNVTKNVNGNDRISLLSLDEFNHYKDKKVAKARYELANLDEPFITRTENSDDGVILSTGEKVSVEDAKNYGVRPIFTLDSVVEDDEYEKTSWKVGDLQIRKIAGKNILFKCIDESYKDKTGNSKKQALFLAQSVLPANIVDDDNTEYPETMFYGENNNYKTSTIRKWLNENTEDGRFSLRDVNVGVDTSFTGKTDEYKYDNFNITDLNKSTFSNTQNIQDKMFILSVEEAYKYRKELWKFNNSEKQNPNTQIKQYLKGYWLRTGVTSSEDDIYYVDLEKGNLNYRKSHPTENDELTMWDNENNREFKLNISDVGVRIAFVLDNE